MFFGGGIIHINWLVGYLQIRRGHYSSHRTIYTFQEIIFISFFEFSRKFQLPYYRRRYFMALNCKMCYCVWVSVKIMEWKDKECVFMYVYVPFDVWFEGKLHHLTKKRDCERGSHSRYMRHANLHVLAVKIYLGVQLCAILFLMLAHMSLKWLQMNIDEAFCFCFFFVREKNQQFNK